MNCKFCYTENPDDATFCKACGKRLDGLAVCKGCSVKIPADSLFCPYCGERQQAEAQPAPAYAPVHTQANTTPAPAPSFITSELAAANAGVMAQPDVAHRATGGGYKHYLDKAVKYALPSAALIIAILSLIFVFFIGYVSSNYYAYNSAVSRDSSGINLFYYFGDAYKELDKVFDNLDASETYYSDFFASSLYIPAAFGTVITVLTLVAVCMLSVFACIRSILCLMGKTQKTGGGLAIAAFLAFVAGVLALYAVNNYYLHSVEVETDYYYGTTTEIIIRKIGINGVTRAGIALGAVFAIIYTALNIAKRGRELLNVKSVVNAVLSLAGIGIMIAVVALCAQPSVKVENDTETVKFGLLYILMSMAVLCVDWEASHTVENLTEIKAYSIVAFILFVITVVFAVRALAGFAKKATDGNGKSHLAVCVLFSVFALLCMTFSIVAGKELIKGIEYLYPSVENKISYTVPIVIFVLSVIAVGLNSAQYCICATKKSRLVEEDVMS